MNIKTQKKFSRYLLITQICIYGFIILHSILWYVFKVHLLDKLCPFVAREQVAGFEFNLTIVFWFLIFCSTLFLGRAFCAWGCMFGAYQDFVSRLANILKLNTMKNKKLGKLLLRGILVLLLAAYVFALGSTMNWPSFFWFTVAVIIIGMILWMLLERKSSENKINTLPKYIFFALFFGGIVAGWISLNVFQKGITLAFGKYDVFYDVKWGLAIIAILVAVGILTGEKRMFCKYLCPVGLSLRFLSAIPFPRKFKVRATNGKCIKCGKCNKECLMDIKPMEQINEHGFVKSPDCINCLVCISTCPKEVIDFTTNQKNIEIKKEE